MLRAGVGLGVTQSALHLAMFGSNMQVSKLNVVGSFTLPSTDNNCNYHVVRDDTTAHSDIICNIGCYTVDQIYTGHHGNLDIVSSLSFKVFSEVKQCLADHGLHTRTHLRYCMACYVILWYSMV